MKELTSSGRLKTKQGESSILIILLGSAVILLVIMPVTALIFDKALVKIAIQELTDEIDIQMYQVYQCLDIEQLSTCQLSVNGDMVSKVNKTLTLNHPQVKEIVVNDVRLEKDMLVMTFEVIMNPTLYRQVYVLNRRYSYEYRMRIPLNGA